MAHAHRTRLGIYDDISGRTLRTVGVSELMVSGSPGVRLATFSLGSCLGVTAYDPVAMVGGLLHCLMPDSRCNPSDAARNPAKYVDTGIACLLHEAERYGARRGRLAVHIAGAGVKADGQDVFRVGEQNRHAAYRVLASHQVGIASEEVGGDRPLTLALDIDSGNVTVRRSSNTSQIEQLGA